MSKLVKVSCMLLSFSLLFAASVFALEVDPAIPGYEKVSGVSGTIKAVGSDTLNNVMALWAEGFKTFYPTVKISIEGKGSSTAPPALIEGTAQFGPMSREMKAKESDEFEKNFGYKPTQLRVAVDAVAVFVHKDNPIESLSLPQLDAIFSKNRTGGYPNDIATWGDVGLTGEWADKPISLYGRNSASGTYAYFKDVALFKGDYKDSVKEQPGSSAVVQGIASDKYGIGYSGVGYKTADVRIVSLSVNEGEEAFDTSAENAYSGDYPLARFLYVYINKNPNEDLDPLRAEFIKYMNSKEGQQGVIKDGFYPISKPLADANLEAAGLK